MGFLDKDLECIVDCLLKFDLSLKRARWLIWRVNHSCCYGIALVRRDELHAQRESLELIAEYEELCLSMEDEAVKLIARASPRLVR